MSSAPEFKPPSAARRVFENDDVFRMILIGLPRSDHIRMLTLGREALPKVLEMIWREVPQHIVDGINENHEYGKLYGAAVKIIHSTNMLDLPRTAVASPPTPSIPSPFVPLPSLSLTFVRYQKYLVKCPNLVSIKRCPQEHHPTTSARDVQSGWIITTASANGGLEGLIELDETWNITDDPESARKVLKAVVSSWTGFKLDINIHLSVTERPQLSVDRRMPPFPPDIAGMFAPNMLHGMTGGAGQAGVGLSFALPTGVAMGFSVEFGTAGAMPTSIPIPIVGGGIGGPVLSDSDLESDDETLTADIDELQEMTNAIGSTDNGGIDHISHASDGIAGNGQDRTSDAKDDDFPVAEASGGSSALDDSFEKGDLAEPSPSMEVDPTDPVLDADTSHQNVNSVSPGSAGEKVNPTKDRRRIAFILDEACMDPRVTGLTYHAMPMPPQMLLRCLEDRKKAGLKSMQRIHCLVRRAYSLRQLEAILDICGASLEGLDLTQNMRSRSMMCSVSHIERVIELAILHCPHIRVIRVPGMFLAKDFDCLENSATPQRFAITARLVESSSTSDDILQLLHNVGNRIGRLSASTVDSRHTYPPVESHQFTILRTAEYLSRDAPHILAFSIPGFSYNRTTTMSPMPGSCSLFIGSMETAEGISKFLEIVGQESLRIALYGSTSTAEVEDVFRPENFGTLAKMLKQHVPRAQSVVIPWFSPDPDALSLRSGGNDIGDWTGTIDDFAFQYDPNPPLDQSGTTRLAPWLPICQGLSSILSPTAMIRLQPDMEIVEDQLMGTGWMPDQDFEVNIQAMVDWLRALPPARQANLFKTSPDVLGFDITSSQDRARLAFDADDQPLSLVLADYRKYTKRILTVMADPSISVETKRFWTEEKKKVDEEFMADAQRIDN